jgi:hypothetical protein
LDDLSNAVKDKMSNSFSAEIRRLWTNRPESEGLAGLDAGAAEQAFVAFAQDGGGNTDGES